MNPQEAVTVSQDKVCAAVVAAQGEMPAVPFDARNPFLKNRYASLGSVISASRPILVKHGLAVCQPATTNNGEVQVHTKILHTSGQEIDCGILSLPIGDEKGKSRAQVLGSIVTYLRRYAWSSALGLYADEDTDGEPERPGKSAGESLPSESDWDAAKPAHRPQDAPDHHNTPPPPSSEPISQPGAMTGRQDRLWKALEMLEAKEGQPNRALLTDFLRGAGVIRQDQEPENWPVSWLPQTIGQARSLLPALAQFRDNQKAVMPYPQQGGPGWSDYVLSFGRNKGQTLGSLPEDIQRGWFHSFECKDSFEAKDEQGNIVTRKKSAAAKAKDRELRDALDAMGADKGWKKEEQ